MQIPLLDPKHFNGALLLSHLGLVECSGPDACLFLQQQLTQELMALPSGASTLAGFCNAKGRLQASMVVIKASNEQLFLILKSDVLQRTLKRLSMFVLRAKLKMSDVSESYALIGLMGEAADQLSRHAELGAFADLQSALGLSRKLLCLPKTSPSAQLDEAFKNHPLASELWDMAEVLSGVAWVGEKTFEHFVPQMLNFESTGAVSFKKGCYPGQEVVARSQFRGTLKRRTDIVFSKTALRVGMSLFSPLHETESCADIAQVAHWGEWHFALACIQVQALELAHQSRFPEGPKTDLFNHPPFWSRGLSLDAASSAPVDIGFWPLPYALLHDI